LFFVLTALCRFLEPGEMACGWRFRSEIAGEALRAAEQQSFSLA
jgi:hypothetical protein